MLRAFLPFLTPSPTLTLARGYAPSRRERLPSFVLAVATSLTLLALLVSMSGYTLPGKDDGARLVAVNLSGEKGEKDKAPAQKAKQAKTATAPHATMPPMVPPHVIVPAQQHYEMPPGFIHMTHDQFAATDVGKMSRADAGSSSANAGDGGDGGEGHGEGPGGARLYNAEWYREPTDAELAGYIPPGHRPGEWAMIACRTIEKFHVEDCQEIDESPRGSGMARALRQAAWQFLVRPPRIDGKAQLGTWVRIRFDFRKAASGDHGDAAGG